MCQRMPSLCLVLILVGFAAMAGAVPVTDPSYIQHDDFVAWNWQILTQEGVAANPGTPSGTTDYIRLYSNPTSGGGPATLDKYVISWPTGDVSGSSGNWYGMGYDKSGLLTSVLQASQLLTAVQVLTPGAVTPIFAFDQSQNNAPFQGPIPPADAGNWEGPMMTEPQALTNRDIWLRGRLILIPNAEVTALGLLGMTSSQVDAALAGLIPAADNVNGVPGVTATGNGNIVTYYFRETFFNDFIDPTQPGFNWSWLPGTFTPSLFGLPVDPSFSSDNNIGGSVADWGGYIPTLDLTQFPDYAMFISLESKFNNNGGEEAYIVGGALQPPAVPEPLTLAGVFFAVGGLTRYTCKRVRSRSTV